MYTHTQPSELYPHETRDYGGDGGFRNSGLSPDICQGSNDRQSWERYSKDTWFRGSVKNQDWILAHNLTLGHFPT